MSAQYKNQVRIIGGNWKRRMLRFPQIEGLRPTPDRVRETLFNWLGQDCTGLTCLDLFSGSGALAFEAASRNASKVVAVETAKPALDALRSNQSTLDARNLEIVWSDGMRFLDSTPERFDVVFLDPPFASDLLAS
ncbi:MAG: 16S rRNA (guanine(966)-N(2))-methyltransferase RsmD, partial [Formivibrio sp.]|nr:16S rRNA (guanine(966)-N(2))-methyltransferase RsmD [Formivibrio sp.]